MVAIRFGLCGLLAMGASVVGANLCQAQNADFPGYLGVYVVEGDDGMQITGFIRDTPAAGLAKQGGIRQNETITRLAGRPTRTLTELRKARNLIPLEKEAKMVLLDRRGNLKHVWISRNPPTYAGPGRAAMAAPDTFHEGGAGAGDEGDFRDKGDGEKEAPGKPDREGDLRDK